jgi:glycosyltransferase involved in cell wall biosynthesis
MNRVIDLLQEHGVASLRINPWDQDCRFTIAHFWGSDESHSSAYRFCRERGIPTIFSVLLPNPTSALSIGPRTRAFVRRIIKGQQFYKEADAIIVLNEAQAQVAKQVVGISDSRIWEVPTIVDPVFFTQAENPNVEEKGTILCVGTICSRKNQLSLLRAAESTDHKVLLCGRYDDSEPTYCEAVQHQLDRYPLRFRRLEDVAPEKLRNLYLQCSVLACISNHETEPASVLEAMICKRPIVTSDRPYGRNPKFNGVYLCDPQNESSILTALNRAIENLVPTYPKFMSENHRSENVITSYSQVYDALSQRHAKL